MSNLKQEILDQPLHAAWAFGSLAPLVLWPGNIFAGALSGVLLALPRELVDQWPINHISNTLIDLFFFALGGALVVLLLR